MNNSQFRRIVLDTPVANNGSSSGAKSSATPSTSALGSKLRSNIPMTPRSLTAMTPSSFARQMAERDAPAGAAPSKRFRSSAAPKGAKLPAGYKDRTLDREAVGSEADDKAARVQALEEAMKLGQMDRETFERVRDEIVGGDVSTTHLVKGLDWKLLQRVRRGDDVLTDEGTRAAKDTADEAAPDVNIDEELDQLEAKVLSGVGEMPAPSQKKKKHGTMASPPPAAGQKRSRDQILADLKASRQEARLQAQQQQQPALGPRFRKVTDNQGSTGPSPRIERDSRGREVLITVGEDGKVKRKVRRADAKKDEASVSHLLMPEKGSEVLGMDVSALASFDKDVPGDDEEPIGDIFEDAGDDYDPLAGLSADSDDSSSEDEASNGKRDNVKSEPAKSEVETSTATKAAKPQAAKTDMLPPPPPSKPRNYFGESVSASTSSPSSADAARETPAALNDPTILSAIRKAASLNAPRSPSPEDDIERAKRARRKEMLAGQDRDAEDLDIGFGGSRWGDDEEEYIGGGGKGGRKKKKKRSGEGDGRGTDDKS
ncbi:MAG: hypothetical protein M1825_001639 [Sarcosagium campestre]|nr:MAG: hypothetical protein M1825_001639 [Sarcosagium campestre]